MVFTKRAAAFIIFTVVVSSVLIPRSALSQAADANGEESAEELVKDLQRADAYDRGPIIGRIAQRGAAAVPHLTEVVSTWRKQGDVDYVAGCMLALSRIGEPAREANEELMEALDAASAQIRYAAAKALGGIWAGAGEGSEDLQELNAALLSAVYSAAYENREAEAYAAAVALIQINDIPIDRGGRPTLSSVSLATLRDQVGTFMLENTDYLPPFEEQPWELLLAAVLRQPRSATGQQAKQMLVQQKPLMAVDSIVRTMREAQVETGSTRWGELADVLTGISGVEVSRDPEGAADEVMGDWTERWLDQLQVRTDAKHRNYSIQRLERVIARAKDDPAPSILSGVETMKTVLLHQLNSPDQLPENISPEAREMLEDPLSLKQEFAVAVRDFAENEQAHRRLQATKRMQRVVDQEEGERVARQFLERLVEFARQEQRRQILVSLERLLRNITGVPIVFGDVSREERSLLIDAWLEKVREQDQ